MTTILRWVNSPTFLIGLLTSGFLVDLVLLGRYFDLNKTDWASWVQAVGSVAAIIVAFLLGERQANKAVDAIRTADKLVVQRKLECIVGISDACADFAKKYWPIFKHEQGFSYLNVAVADLDVDIRHLVGALDSIPVHEIGSFDSVTALIELKKNAVYLERALIKALKFAADVSNRDGDWVKYETTFVTMNCDLVIKRSARLTEALAAQIAE